MIEHQKVALVHDFLTVWGGAEQVLAELAEMYPDAPIYTLLADTHLVQQYFPGREIHQSFLGKLPNFFQRRPWWLLPLFPVAVETFDLRDFSIVISSSGAWSKGVITRLHTKHIAYLHSPMRFVWDSFHWHPLLAKQKKIFQRLFLSYIRLWDKEAAARPDILIANSIYTKERIQKYYRREARVVFPPVRLVTERVKNQERTYFLVVSRLTKAKGIELVVEAFNKLGLSLIIVGDGREGSHLKKRADNNITFVGRVSPERLSELYQGARAFIQATPEDFGLAMVEALGYGVPVIALNEGGAREIITPGKSGEFFFAPTPEVLADGVRRFLKNESLYDESIMMATARRFTPEIFRTAMKDLIQGQIPEL